MKMNYNKKIIALVILAIIGLAVFLYIKNKEVKVDWDQSITNYIALKDNAITVDGNGVTIKDNTININYSGIYELSGTLSNGKIVVSIKDDGNVKLILNNVEVSSDTYALFIENTKNTTIILKDDTTNTLIDGNNKRDEDGVIYSKDDLILEGRGILNIKSKYLDGIVSKDALTIKEGTYNIESNDDAIRGKDYIDISNGTFNIKSASDAFKSTNTEDNTLGYILVNNGVFNIDSESDAFDSETSLTIYNGEFNIKTGGGSINSSSNSKGMWQNYQEDSISAKGLKGKDITIANGTFNIDSSDDAVHSNNNINITNGVFNITSGDDGIHADTSMIIDNGTFNIDKSYEGIESANITINNGTFHIISSDDGINIAGGNDESSMGRPGENNMSKSTNQYLTINDGYIYLDTTGDGLDANGGIKILGGTVIINGPMNDGNGSLDYDVECIVDGGTLISAGSSGMLQTPSSNSKLYTLSVVFDTSINEIIHIKDNNGSEILTFKPSKNIESLVFTSPLLKNNSTYSIYINGTYTKEGIDGIYSGGTYNGTLYKSATLSSKVTSLGTPAMDNNMMDKKMRR